MPTQPTADEQYLLELVNRERGKAGAAPLAFDLNLNTAAENHSKWMLSTDTFSHTGAGGSNVGDRITSAGYTGWTSWGENIALQYVRAPTGLRDEVDSMHTGLMNSAGHRANILNTGFREIGIGLEAGDYRGGNTAMVTEAFGRQGGSPILTGVAFKDADGDRFYDPGEGLGGVTVKVVGSAGTFTTTTMASGGYQLDLGAGSYQVTFSGSGVVHSQQVTMGSQNVKLDATGSSSAPTPTPTPVPQPDDLIDLPVSATPTRTITGTQASDTLIGTSGHDLIDGLSGADRMTGGQGDDSYKATNGWDKTIELEGQGIDTVLSKGDWFTLGNHVENLTLTGARSQSGTGNGLDNILTSNDVQGILDGGAGHDILDAGKGADILKGGTGADLFLFDSLGSNHHVTDFVATQDKIGLHELFGDASVDPIASRQLLIKANGHGGTVILIDQDGIGSAAPAMVVTLDNILPSALDAHRDISWS